MIIAKLSASTYLTGTGTVETLLSAVDEVKGDRIFGGCSSMPSGRVIPE